MEFVIIKQVFANVIQIGQETIVQYNLFPVLMIVKIMEFVILQKEYVCVKEIGSEKVVNFQFVQIIAQITEFVMGKQKFVYAILVMGVLIAKNHV